VIAGVDPFAIVVGEYVVEDPPPYFFHRHLVGRKAIQQEVNNAVVFERGSENVRSFLKIINARLASFTEGHIISIVILNNRLIFRPKTSTIGRKIGALDERSSYEIV